MLDAKAHHADERLKLDDLILTTNVAMLALYDMLKMWSQMAARMLTVTKIAGTASEPAIADLLHDLDHRGKVEILTVDRSDTLRRRLRGMTDKGTEVVVALDRSEQLADGAVLSLESDRAIVVRMTEERWLRITPRDLDCALETGYFAGNFHWRVRFEPGTILVALEGPAENYISRLAHLTMQGKIRLADHG